MIRQGRRSWECRRSAKKCRNHRYDQDELSGTERKHSQIVQRRSTSSAYMMDSNHDETLRTLQGPEGHPVLGCRELVDAICHFCDRTTRSISCLAISDNALNALWYKIESIVPLIRCMPDDLWDTAPSNDSDPHHIPLRVLVTISWRHRLTNPNELSSSISADWFFPPIGLDSTSMLRELGKSRAADILIRWNTTFSLAKKFIRH